MKETSKAVVTVIGKDMVGILAKVSTACAEANTNVIEVTQSVLDSFFCMVMIIDITESDKQIDQLQKSIEEKKYLPCRFTSCMRISLIPCIEYRKRRIVTMLNMSDIIETITMIQEENLDIRTITMGISLIDCADSDIDKSCEKVYNKIYSHAKDLVKTGKSIEKKYGIPIVNKRIAVTPISMLAGVSGGDPVKYAKTLDRVAHDVGVNFIGGFSALVQKGFSAGDRELIESIPRALSETELVCSSVNVGSTKAGINMDAVKIMGETVRQASELTKDKQCIGAAKLVVFCNAVEDNPFMAGAFHGVGEADCVISVGVSGPGVVRSVLSKMPADAPINVVAEAIKRLLSRSPASASWSVVKLPICWMWNSASSTCPWRRHLL